MTKAAFWTKAQSLVLFHQRTHDKSSSSILVFRRPSNAGASNSLNSGGLDGHGAISFFGHLARTVECFAAILAFLRIFWNFLESFGIFWNHLDSLEIFWILLEFFGVLLESYGMF